MSLNQAHLKRMRDIVGQMRSEMNMQTIGLQITNLESLCAAIQPYDEDWSRRFAQAWAILDEVYAVSLDMGRSNFTADEKHLLNSAVKRLDLLLDEAELPSNLSNSPAG